jgi:hypothetical protein
MKHLGKFVDLVSAEWVLEWSPNGGGAIAFRAAFVACVFFSISIAFVGVVEPTTGWTFDSARLRELVIDHLPWFGVFFAGAYAALYARFSAQWEYLADVYNCIMAAQVTAPRNDANAKAYDLWMAGFVEDAHELSLHRKPIFASIVLNMIEKPEVCEAFVASTAGGQPRLDKIRLQAHEAMRLGDARYLRPTEVESQSGRHSRWYRVLFTVAAAYGLIALLPMYFQAPPDLTHPEFYFGFIGVATAWQFAFLIIAADPMKYRLLILPGILEKLGFGVAALILYAQGRTPGLMALAGGIDLLMAALFAWAFVALSRSRD